jgi:hypothetical protein
MLVSALALAVGAWRLRTSYVLFMLASFWFFMSTAFILSTARYASALFPIYLLLGGAFEGRPRLFKVYIGVSTALLITLGFAMTRGEWIA